MSDPSTGLHETVLLDMARRLALGAGQSFDPQDAKVREWVAHQLAPKPRATPSAGGSHGA